MHLHSSCRYVTLFILGLALAPEPVAADPLEPAGKEWLEANYTKHEYRVPMRDGARLFTAVYAPKEEDARYPIWLLRTPYGIRPYGSDKYPDPHGAMHYYGREKFIFVFQDVRGRNGSEGEFLHVRPIQPERAPAAATDESTDAWDTIDWLVKNLPHNNGNVGMSGISYPGFYAACGAINSHPALKAVSPQAPITDWFIGDDDHHNGVLFLAAAFGFYAHFEQKLDQPTREDPKSFDYETPDGYEFFLNLGSLANVNERYFKGKRPFWNDLMSHGVYDEFWRARDLRPHLKNIRCAMLTVGGWHDAEDLFGPLQIHRQLARQNSGAPRTLVMGPWSHGQWGGDDGARLGQVNFRSKTAEYFRQHIELPFFKHYLKGETNLNLADAIVFETGTCQWRRFDAWPPANATAKTLFFQADGRLAFDPPGEGEKTFDEYLSDPAKPVPYTAETTTGMTREYMVEDQRFAASRPDVLVYKTEPLEADLTLAGPIEVSLQVSTTGTDSDWVVKLIDVYPGDYPNPENNPTGAQMGGYQQLLRGEPMRGKFRESYEHPLPFEPGKVTPVHWTMPDVFHTFRRGHRIMVQVQSSWFPLTDRNPQTFCDIYHARPEDFRKATQRVYRSAKAPSALQVRVLPAGK
jgi:uncharacterized protein